MPNGILVIDKPEGWTSMDVCAKLRGMLHEKRVGHAGTLDPMATGVLPVFVGRATRAVEFATDSEKEYVTGLKLGVITNTQDTTGEVLEKRPVEVTREDLERALPAFRGDILQVPPMYSAIKIQGKKLYQLARAGKEVERPPRPVTIHELEVLDGREAAPCGVGTEPDTWLLRVRCSKGTYVRTLCHDIGMALGCGGAMSSLRRTMAGGFTLDDAVTLEGVLSAPDPAALLRPVDACFADRPALTLPAGAEKKVRNGVPVSLPRLADGEYRVYAPDGTFLALSRARGGTLTTVRSFFEADQSPACHP